MRKSIWRDRAGFSLVEVLVALAILTGIGMVATNVLATSDRSAAHGLAKFRAVVAAESVLERVGLDLPISEDPLVGEDAGGMRWTLTFEPYDALEPERGQLPMGLVLARVSATAPGAPTGSVQLQTLVAIDRPGVRR